MKGFSLIELMITICIAGILSTVAIPQYQTWLANNRASVYANQLMSDLRYARSVAMMQNQANSSISICQPTTASGYTCDSSTQWQKGWVVVDANNTVIRNFQFNNTFTAVNTGISLSTSGSGTPSTLSFMGNGMPLTVPKGNTNASYSFTIKPPNCSIGYIINIPIDGQINQQSSAC